MDTFKSVGCVCGRIARRPVQARPSTSKVSSTLLIRGNRRQASSKAGDKSSADGDGGHLTPVESSPAAAQDSDSPALELSGETEGTDESSAYQRGYPRLTAWLSKDGRSFKRPMVGRTNWLGGNIPFPLNKSFRPPTPISNEQKQRIYEGFLHSIRIANQQGTGEQDGAPAKSETYHVRRLSQTHGLSIDRVRAIVRLKALEHNLRQSGNELQMKFLVGMEQALGVSDGRSGIGAYRAVETRVHGEAGEGESAFKIPRKAQFRMVDDENQAEVQEVETLLDQKHVSPKEREDAAYDAKLRYSIRKSEKAAITKVNKRVTRRHSERRMRFVDVATPASRNTDPKQFRAR